MAQQFIKIFDDTVLKQSVNQGYETQRTNTRLGKFTMGELAFTRDTARLFVGSSTNLDLPKDTQELIGGSLVGNKYLGLVDSKPLTHFRAIDVDGEPVKTCVHLPLNYESVNYSSKSFVDENGVNFKFEEAGVLTQKSKFRTDRNDGWDKNAIYNTSYDAYNGDFLFDVFNNALILFDNRIKPVDPSEPQTQWVVENGVVQKFIKPDGTFYSEEGDKNNFSTFRTRLQNVKKSEDEQTFSSLGNPDYPIYGNGYVIMRIVEPDGVSLGYVEKEFNQSDGTAINGNYSHNYIEIKKVKPECVIGSFNSSQFEIKDGVISLVENDEPVIIPDELNFFSGLTINFAQAQNKEGYLYMQNSDGTTVIGDAPSLDITFRGETRIITLTPGSHSINLDEIGDENKANFFENFVVTRPFGMGSSTDCVYAGNLVFNNITGELSAFEEVPEITQKIKNAITFTEKQVNDYVEDIIKENQIEDPETIEQIRNQANDVINNSSSTDEDTSALFILYDSSGDSYYSIIQNDTEPEEDTSVYYGRFKHPYVNTGQNMIKNPEPIAWGTGSNKYSGQFFLYPYLISPRNFNSKNFGTIGTVLPDGNAELYEKVSQKDETTNQEIIVDKPAGTLNDVMVWDKDFINRVRASMAINMTGYMGIFIPDHAKSIICELHYNVEETAQSNPENTEPIIQKVNHLTISTAHKHDLCCNELLNENFNLIDFDNFSISSIPTVSSEINHIKSILHISNVAGTYVETVEFPLYRDENQMKFFNFGITNSLASTKWVLRPIGYNA